MALSYSSLGAGLFFIGLPTSFLSGFFDAVSSSYVRFTPYFFALLLIGGGFLLWSSAELVELFSESEDEATLSPELLLDRYLLLFVFDRLVLLKSDMAGLLMDESFDYAENPPSAFLKKPVSFFSST